MKKIEIMISVILILSAQIGFAQKMQEQVEDKFGNLIHVQTDLLKGNVKSLSGLKANLSRYETDAKKISSETVESVSNSILIDYIEFFDVEFSNLNFGYASNRNGKWNVKYSQKLNNVPVYGASIGFTTDKEGRILSIGGNLYPNISVNTTPSITVSDAVSTAQDHFRSIYGSAGRTDDEPLLYVYPMNKDGKQSTTIAFRFVLTAENAAGKHIYFVDGHSGVILVDYTAYIHIMPAGKEIVPSFNVDGNISRDYYPEHHYDTPLKSGDNAGIEVSIVKVGWPPFSSGDVTSSLGNYNIGVGVDYEIGDDFNLSYSTYFNYSGTYVKIQNGASGGHIWNFQAPASGSTLNHNVRHTNDESNVFHHANLTHDFYKASPFNYTEMDYQMKANVHDGSSTNGKADRVDIYFGSEDNQEWAKSSDVVIHEYTHNVIAHLYKDTNTGAPLFIKDYKENGTQSYWQARSMDEGISDYWAASINNDSIFGESVIVAGECPGGPRNLMNNRQYDLFNFDDVCESRISSLVISGANWRMRQNLGDVDLADGLVFDALDMATAFTFREFLDNILTKDDNDANLSNGTPNIDDILYAYEHHGIYPTILAVPPAKPKNILISAQNNYPKIDWDSNTEPDLLRYRVYKALDIPNNFSLLAVTTNNYYVDLDNQIGNDHTAYYKIKAEDNSNNYSNYSDMVQIGVAEAMKATTSFGASKPKAYALDQNHPNPFNPETRIDFALPDPGRTRIIIYDLLGREAARLVDKFMTAGFHQITWNASNVPSGIYFYRLTSGDFVDTKKLLLLK